MRFEGYSVPGANWVEIVRITEKDGTPLAPDNWRNKLFGRVTLCWIAGGFQKRGAFFKGKLRLENGKPVDIDLDTERWTSTTSSVPIEVESGVYDLETNTSVYRFRLLTEEEQKSVMEAVRAIIQRRLEVQFRNMVRMANPPVAAGGDGPVS